MMTNGDKILITIMVVIIACGSWFAGYRTGKDHATDDIQKEAVAKGFAQYNQTNGVWQWKTK